MATESALAKQKPTTATPVVVTRANSSAIIHPMVAPQNGMAPNGMMAPPGMNPMSAFHGMANQMLSL